MNAETRRPYLLGDGRLAVLPKYGKVYIDARVLAAFSDLGDRLRIKDFRHAELDVTGDTQDLTVRFAVDGVTQGDETVALESTGSVFGTATFSSDGSGGTFSKPRPQLLRAWKPSFQRGRLSRTLIRSWSRSEMRLHRMIFNFAIRNAG